MVWKYPTVQNARQMKNEAPELSNEKFDRVMRGKSKSTYQVDYKGLPPGE